VTDHAVQWNDLVPGMQWSKSEEGMGPESELHGELPVTVHGGPAYGEVGVSKSFQGVVQEDLHRSTPLPWCGATRGRRPAESRSEEISIFNVIIKFDNTRNLSPSSHWLVSS
jgi:hypothetical protein